MALRDGIGEALLTPQARSALLNFGVTAMQPVGFGQSPLGQFGQALGRGAEAATSVQDVEREAQRYTDKQALEQQKLKIAQQRADAATTQAGAYEQGLKLSELLTKQRQDRTDLAKFVSDRILLNPVTGADGNVILDASTALADPIVGPQLRKEFAAHKAATAETVPVVPGGTATAGAAPAGAKNVRVGNEIATLAPDGEYYITRGNRYVHVKF